MFYKTIFVYFDVIKKLLAINILECFFISNFEILFTILEPTLSVTQTLIAHSFSSTQKIELIRWKEFQGWAKKIAFDQKKKMLNHMKDQNLKATCMSLQFFTMFLCLLL